jgi:hypothetical protein
VDLVTQNRTRKIASEGPSPSGTVAKAGVAPISWDTILPHAPWRRDRKQYGDADSHVGR